MITHMTRLRASGIRIRHIARPETVFRNPGPARRAAGRGISTQDVRLPNLGHETPKDAALTATAAIAIPDQKPFRHAENNKNDK